MEKYLESLKIGWLSTPQIGGSGDSVDPADPAVKHTALDAGIYLAEFLS